MQFQYSPLVIPAKAAWANNVNVWTGAVQTRLMVLVDTRAWQRHNPGNAYAACVEDWEWRT